MSRPRSRLRDALESLSLARKKKPTLANQQTGSPLFQLPFELRELIWSFALTPTNDAPHFHVYDTVHDACTYEKPKDPKDPTHRRRGRRDPKHMSLLLTCRAAYFESLEFLYNHTNFTLVLFAGNARPESNLKAANCLGRVIECERFFSRMRKVTLVIQPGRRPNTEKYVARLLQLLRVMNNCDRVQELCVQFNLHYSFLSQKNGNERFEAIMKAFYPLRMRKEALMIETCSFWGISRLAEPFEILHRVLPPQAEWQSWSHTEETSSCVMRGTFGAPDHHANHSTRSRAEKYTDRAIILTVLGTYVALSPFTIPLSCYLLNKRKRDKGER